MAGYTEDQIAGMSDAEFAAIDWAAEIETSSEPVVNETGSEEPVLSGEPEDVAQQQEEPQGEENYEDPEPSNEPEAGNENTAPEQPEIDYEAEYKKLIGAAIKGGGEEITLNNADEALSLIQKGIGVNKKFEQLAVHRKQLHKLDEAKLLNNDADLNLMLDIYSGDKEAIRKFLADKEIDLADLDSHEEIKYQTKQQDVDNATLDLREKLQEMNATESGRKTMNILANNWDLESRKQLLGSMENLAFLEAQVSDGTYDKVMGEVKRRMTLGTLPSTMGTLQAYALVGKELIGGQPTQAPQPNQNLNPQQPTQRQSAPPDNRNRASKPRKVANRQGALTDDYIASLSDEEFLKLDIFK
jgi:hypothetical protein